MKSLLFFAVTFFCLSVNAQNYSLNFNGSSQYISIADQNSIDLSVNFTLEGWLYPAGVGSSGTEGGCILNKEYSYEIARFPDGTIQYALSANGNGTDWSWINTGLVLPLNTWSHFALVKTGTTVYVYLNGVLGYTNIAAPLTLTANTQTLRIANRGSSAHFFNGNMDEVRIWNTVRTAAEVKTYMFNRNLTNAASGLVGYYKMNENTGSTTANSCTNAPGLDGTLISTPAWNASPVQFKANALAFDGINDVVNIADNSNLQITTAITLEAWVYATSTSSVQNVVSKSSNTINNGYIFPRTDNGWNSVVAYLHIAGNWKTVAAAYPSLNAWHHLAVTYDGVTIKLYIDGTLANSLAQTGTITVNNNLLTLGNQTGYSEFFGGYVDEVRIWNVARTQAQIQAAKNTELDPATQIGLVSYYTLNQGNTTGTNTGLTIIPDQKNNNNGAMSNFTSTGTTSNFVAQFTTLSALPVSWLSFTAQKQNNNVVLNWSTASEQNSASFTLQHSTDGYAWTNIGTLPAAGNIGLVQQYSFTDAQPANGANYYRILQQDLDGKFSYSKVIGFVYQGQSTQLKIYPNPVTNGILHIQLQSPAAVSVYSNKGDLVIRTHLSAGTQQLDISGLAKGSYQVKVGGETVGVLVQ